MYYIADFAKSIKSLTDKELSDELNFRITKNVRDPKQGWFKKTNKPDK